LILDNVDNETAATAVESLEMLKTAEHIVFENNLNDQEILAVNYSNMSKERYLAGKEAAGDEILATAE
jgi:hypothetical protein